MANSKISQLPAGGNIQNTDLLPIARGSSNFSITGQQINSKLNSVSVNSANGFDGEVSSGSSPQITLKTTVTGIIKGNGTALEEAEAGVDYLTPTSVIDGGTF